MAEMTYQQKASCYRKKVEKVSDQLRECYETREALLREVLADRGLDGDVLFFMGGAGVRGRFRVYAAFPLLTSGELHFHKYTKNGVLSQNKSATVLICFSESDEAITDKLRRFKKA